MGHWYLRTRRGILVVATLIVLPSALVAARSRLTVDVPMPTGFTGRGIAVLVVLAAGGIGIALGMPRRLMPQGSDEPSVREAYRGNVIQLVTVLLVVWGLVVGLLQLDASLDELRTQEASRFADEIAEAEARLNADAGTEEQRLDAISDLQRIHRDHADGRFSVERMLLRFVQHRAQIQDEAAGASAPVSVVQDDVQAALTFILEDGQRERELDWDMAPLRASTGGLPLADLDLRGASLPGVNLERADLSRTLLDGADLQRARLGGSLLVETSLQGAKLQGANLRGADLRGANLLGAAMSRVDVAGTDLGVARNLTWAQVADTSVDCGTNVPSALPEDATKRDAGLPTIFVLADCFVPTEIRIAANVPTTLRVVMLANMFARVAVVDLGINTPLPAWRTGAIAINVRASAGQYAVTNPLTGDGFQPASLIVTVQTDRSGLGGGAQGGSGGTAAGATAPASPAASPVVEATEVAVPTPHAEASATPAASYRPTAVLAQPTSQVVVMPETGDRDCSDFSSQEEAQAFYEEAGGPMLDLHRLDRDGDGIACGPARDGG